MKLSMVSKNRTSSASSTVTALCSARSNLLPISVSFTVLSANWNEMDYSYISRYTQNWLAVNYYPNTRLKDAEKYYYFVQFKLTFSQN